MFATFLLLGCTSFGGPVAHVGIFHDALVRRRSWLTDEAYAGLVSLCQLLPGPASSKLGFIIGYQRAGMIGAVTAWFAFTAPSSPALAWWSCAGHACGW